MKSLGVAVEENIRELLEVSLKKLFWKIDANWVGVLRKKTKHYNNGKQSSTKLTPIRLKKNEGYVY